jgi:hypothetical protein
MHWICSTPIFLTILKVYPFLIEICMGGTLQSLQFCPWFRKLLPKLPSDLFWGEICLTKFKILPFLDGICMGGTLRMSNFIILSIFLRFLDPNIGHKNVDRSVLGWNLQPNLRILPFLVEICIGGTLRMSKSKILSIYLGSWTSI